MNSTELAHPTALVVDDDPAVVHLLGEVLDKTGYAVTSFTRGQPALDALWDRTFTVILTAHWLPDVNGEYLCVAVRSRYGPDPAVFFVTEGSRRDCYSRLIDLGADGCVLKPVDVDQLIAQIERRLGVVRKGP
jgi:DNA-binding response OmpR family regulator